MKNQQAEGITFKSLVTLFKAFCDEPHLNESQLNTMTTICSMLNAIDKRNTLNDGKDYKVIEQLPILDETDNNPFYELDVEREVVESYDESLAEWKADFVKSYSSTNETLKADLIKAKNNLSELDVKEDAIVKLQDENEKLKADKKTLNERLTKVAVKRDELELALQDSYKIRVDLETDLTHVISGRNNLRDKCEKLYEENENLQADLIKAKNNSAKLDEVEDEAIGEIPIAVKTTSSLSGHEITIYNNNTVDVFPKDIENTLQGGTLKFNAHIPNSTILEYCERNVV